MTPMHIMPLNDLREHVADGVFCPCLPRVLPGDRYVDGADRIVHNSYDRRETGEVCRHALGLLALALVGHDHTLTAQQRDAYDHAILVLNMHWPPKPSEPRPGLPLG